MAKVPIQGLAVFAAGLVALIINRVLNLELGSIALGLAIGAALGLVTSHGVLGRIGGFLLGVVVAVVMYGVRTLFLNTSFEGQVAGLTITLVLIVLICAVTGGRLPLWSALLGSALVVGAYETPYLSNPSNLTSELVQYTTMALLPAALAFLGAVLVSNYRSGDDPGAESPPGSEPAPEPTVSLAKSEG